MTKTFNTWIMVKEIIVFLEQLRKNNNRPWFQDNKDKYDVLRAQFEKDVNTLIQHISLFDAEVIGMEPKDCIYRIYRDIRFSPDKTPYKTYFSAYIALGGRKSERAGYYLHLEPDNCFLSGGVWCPPSPLLKMLRQAIFDHIEEFSEITENKEFKEAFPEMQGEVLQRLPQAFINEKDFPRPDLLKRKDYVVIGKKDLSFFEQPDWIKVAANEFKKMQPFNRFLNYTVDEYLGRID